MEELQEEAENEFQSGQQTKIECHLLIQQVVLLVVLSSIELQIDVVLALLHMSQLALGHVALVSAIFP